MARKNRRRPHGMGCVYQRGPGNFWIKWREGGQVRYEGSFPTRDLAERALAKIVNDVKATGVGLAPDPKSLPTLTTLWSDWIERRRKTHRAADTDESRWETHLGPAFGGLRPPELNAATIRRFVEQKLAEGLAPQTVGHCVRLLSTFCADLVERGLVTTNPVATVPRSTRRLMRSNADPRTVPFLERADDIRRVFLAMPEPYRVAFAVGALAGLRTGEVLGLAWEHIDLATRRIHVRQQVQDGELGPLKDDDSRIVPIMDALAPTLAAWKLKRGGKGPLFPPRYGQRGGRPGRPPQFTRPHTLHSHLADALGACELPTLTWYQATRHTFASQWVAAGGSIEKLSLILGHASVTTTERYAHLRVDLFLESDYATVQVDLATTTGDVVALPRGADSGAVGYAVVTPKVEHEAEAG